ncbi:MAG: hypothetical protein MH204_04570, partial [Fimbriimonadaceae bacterium]|nr:hypothetical protein [Fimbriimonadaceae bacterium]
MDDPEAYRTMRSGELIGIPQSASPAMRQAHMRLQTENLTDAALVQAGIRPGVGGAVKINELIARRRGLKSYTFDHPELERILGHTYGIVVFQEQIDMLLTAFVGCSGGEAEDIREEIHKRRREDYGQVIREDLLRRMMERGFSRPVAEQVFELVAGFKGYGFAQGHALAFAEISVRSIHCQQNHPAEYFAALFDAQPAGYYGPCTLANEARMRGVRMLPPRLGCCDEGFRVEDVVSGASPQTQPAILTQQQEQGSSAVPGKAMCIVVPGGGIRVGLKQVKGLSTASRRLLLDLPPGLDLAGFFRRARIPIDEMERLVQIGYLDELHPHRRSLLWALPRLLEWGASETAGLDIQEPLPPIPDGDPDFSRAEKDIRE